MKNLKDVNKFIKKVEDTIKNPIKPEKGEEIHVGVDLGTAFIVIVVLGKDFRPLGCEMKFAQVIKDGLVVDYIGAQRIVKELKESLEDKLSVEINKAAIAVPPGTGEADSKTHKYVVEGAGIDVSNVLDEPTAANEVLHLENGAIVDIGGGTTGISILKDNKVEDVYDEATGGTHLSLVLSGRFGIPFEEAEKMKRNKRKHSEVFLAVRPVMEKMATIVDKEIKDKDVEEIVLVGGTCLLKGIDEVFNSITGKKIVKPYNPLLITPIGIAMSDRGWFFGER